MTVHCHLLGCTDACTIRVQSMQAASIDSRAFVEQAPRTLVAGEGYLPQSPPLGLARFRSPFLHVVIRLLLKY